MRRWCHVCGCASSGLWIRTIVMLLLRFLLMLAVVGMRWLRIFFGVRRIQMLPRMIRRCLLKRWKRRRVLLLVIGVVIVEKLRRILRWWWRLWRAFVRIHASMRVIHHHAVGKRRWR